MNLEIFRALDTPRRIELLRIVWNREQTVTQIAGQQPDITMGAISQHLQILEQAGLVSHRKDGVRHIYSARKAELGPLAEWLESMWSSALHRLKIKAELEEARRGPRGSLAKPQRRKGIASK